jgi:hypothetical protein
MKLNEVVPWGRSLSEYQAMFALTDQDLDKYILGCGDGPASFNSEMTTAGRRVVSVDPIYAFSGDEIRQRIGDTYQTIVGQARRNTHRYCWTRFRDADELGRVRLGVMEAFLHDFDEGLASGRYRCEALPSLPFEDRQFKLCLCSHLLFLYSEQLSLDFHLVSIRELLRVAEEVRVFPLVSLDCEPSPHLGQVIEHFASLGFAVAVRRVPYEFQRGGDAMLTLQPK